MLSWASLLEVISISNHKKKPAEKLPAFLNKNPFLLESNLILNGEFTLLSECTGNYRIFFIKDIVNC